MVLKTVVYDFYRFFDQGRMVISSFINSYKTSHKIRWIFFKHLQHSADVRIWTRFSCTVSKHSTYLAESFSHIQFFMQNKMNLLSWNVRDLYYPLLLSPLLSRIFSLFVGQTYHNFMDNFWRDSSDLQNVMHLWYLLCYAYAFIKIQTISRVTQINTNVDFYLSWHLINNKDRMIFVSICIIKWKAPFIKEYESLIRKNHGFSSPCFLSKKGIELQIPILFISHYRSKRLCWNNYQMT